MKMAMLFPDYLPLAKLPADCMETTGSVGIRLLKRLFLAAKQGFNQVKIKLIFVKYLKAVVVYRLSNAAHDKQSTC